MSPSKEIINKDEVTQAVLIANDFGEAFEPFTSESPLVLLPLINKPIIDYTLEFLALGGIKEVFIFCSSHGRLITEYINETNWSQSMKLTILKSESCSSLGDCLRDLDSKGVIQGDFVLLEPGVLGNVKLLPLLKQHSEVSNNDKSAAMTLVFQETGLNQYGQSPQEKFLVAINKKNRILTHKLTENDEKKIKFPLDVFMENSCVSIKNNLRDTHISICSPSLLPLFSDNFDYQTRHDFIRSVLMIDEVMEHTIYCHILKKDEHAAAITNWQMYQAVCKELMDKWFYPLSVNINRSRAFGRNVFIGDNCKIANSAKIKRSIIGNNVTIAENVTIEDSYLFSGTTVKENSTLIHSLVGTNSLIAANKEIEDLVVIKNMESSEENQKFPRLMDFSAEISDCEESDTSDSDEELPGGDSPVPDDTNMFFNEVVDSLVRGFDDKLQCDNLILEINSSRYAYNVSLKEVNYHVSKAILVLPFQQSSGLPYMQALSRCLAYFSPILKNYIHTEEAMSDCLQAIEEVAMSNKELPASISKILHWFYDKDHLTEEAILSWFQKLSKESPIYKPLIPFVKWLQEAEEASTEEED